ncbi:hypothetical protein WJX73_005439 [Symbiochloris irregularis]|uniref:NADH-ubiquinone oxidoreductase 9.5 kDa subunit n=1 Tax=Symbiochloris irregularis TaxID=706552 RepID=A0AAW1PG69_9CHLO
MSAAAWFRTAMHQEPIVMWSCIIGGIGLVSPLVVPPIREYFNPPAVTNPRPFKQVIEDARAGAKSATS